MSPKKTDSDRPKLSKRASLRHFRPRASASGASGISSGCRRPGR